MTTHDLENELAEYIDGRLAGDLVHEFEGLRNDCKTNTLGGTSAGKMIEYIQVPVSPVVEQLGDRKLVYGNFSADDELLILLHSYYPEQVSRQTIQTCLDRRARSTISNSLARLWKYKLIHRGDEMYRLTQAGYQKAKDALQRS